MDPHVDRFAELVHCQVVQQLAADDVAPVVAFLEQRELGLEYARRGLLPRAAAKLDSLRRQLATSPAGEAAALVMAAFLDAAEAYLHYRRDEQPRAAARLLCASAHDDVLMRRHGLVALQAHRVQLGHNLVRVRARQGDPAAAAQLAGELIDFLQRRTSRLPDELGGEHQYPDAIPCDIREWQLQRIRDDLAAPLAVVPPLAPPTVARLPGD